MNSNMSKFNQIGLVRGVDTVFDDKQKSNDSEELT